MAEQATAQKSPPPPPAAPPGPARIVPQITPDRMKQREHNTAAYDIVLQAGVEPDDILPVAYWSHLAETFRAAKLHGDVELTVMTEDLKWRGELVVIDAGVNWARVVFKTTENGQRFITKLGGLQPQKIVILAGHTVNYAGIFDKWRVVRDSDGQVLTRNHNTEGECYTWLSEYAKSIRTT
jgi:hypothetical protein